MKQFKTLIILSFILSSFSIQKVAAQCAAGSPPSFPTGCTSQYFTSITASGSGAGFASTISYSSGSCIGTYFDFFTTQGIVAPTGSTVSINISRITGYSAYAAVYIDWNNNGVYETSELAGSIVSLPSSVSSTVYNFTIPMIGIVTNTNLHMRVFLGEPPSAGGPLSSINPPCSAKYGEACDYYFNASCTNPVLSISPASPTVCVGNSIALTASGAGTAPVYLWTPATSLSATTGASVTTSPTTATTYTVTGYGPGVCLSTTTTTVAVIPGITAGASAAGPTSFCGGSGVLLSETSGSGIKYQWYNGPAPIGGATNSTYFASPSTSASISVLITDARGCTSTAAVPITIFATPAAVITPAGPTTVCAPSSVLLSATAGSGYKYRWFNTAGVISGATTQNYSAGSSDAYTVEIIAPGTGCIDTSASLSVTINPAPVAAATAVGSYSLCAYDSIILKAVTTPGYTYQWVDGTTSIPGATDSAYTTNAIGTHDYRLKVTNGFGCTDITASGLFPVFVSPAPISDITASGPLSFCNGGSVLLSTLFVAGNTYQWYYGATVATALPISGSIAPSFIASTTGYYYVQVTTPAGCTTNSSASAVLVSVIPPPVIAHTTPLDVCWGSHAILSLGISPLASGVTFQWKNNGVDIPGADSNVYDATLAGTYTCLVRVAGSCSSTTPAVTMTIHALPNPTIVFNGGFLKTETYYRSYQWFQSMVPIPGALTYKVAPHTNGTYSVIVTDTNLCMSVATTYPLHTLATEEIATPASCLIYPNPATNKVYVNYQQNTNIEIAGLDGKILLKKYAAKEIDINTLANGLYMIIVYDELGNKLLAQQLLKK